MKAVNPSKPGSVAEAWGRHSEPLAHFAWSRIVVRQDVYGGYHPDGSPTTERGPLTLEILIRHFRGQVVIGLHTTSPDGKCLVLTIDIDAHDDQADPQANWRFALFVCRLLIALGLRPLIFDSNGRGGYHVRTFFKKPVPVEVAHWLGQRVIADHAEQGLPKPPETFPKQAELTIDCPYGNWVRPPGKHHKRDHWSRIYDPKRPGWLEGEDAVVRLLKVAGDDPGEVLKAYRAEQEAMAVADTATGNGSGEGSPFVQKATAKAKGGRKTSYPKPDEATVKEALGFLPNDWAKSYGGTRTDTGWLGTGMALHNWDSNRGLPLWKDFSARCPEKSNDAVCDEKWATFNEGGGLTVGTIFKEAERGGWTPPWKRNGHVKGDGNGTPPDVGSADVIEAEPIRPNEAIDDPHRLARLYRDARCLHPDGLTVRYWQGTWNRWREGAYHETDEKELRADVGPIIKAEFDRLNVRAVAAWQAAKGVDERGKAIPKPTAFKVTEPLKSNVLGNLAGLTLLDSAAIKGPPGWLDGPGPWPAGEVLPCRNALVHLPSLVKGEPGIRKPTPRFFVPYALDYDFDPEAPEPAHWLEFLGQLWPDDPQSIQALQEWFGLCLTPDTSHQKILALIGPRRSGKGTIGRVKRALIGPENVAGPTLSSLTGPFGLQPLVGKLAAIISDARLSGRTDAAVIVERLLSISGEDALTVERKHTSAWTGRLIARFMLISNQLPRLSDSSGALAGRLILLPLTRSFYGKEDRALESKLLSELPGILLWAIEGWRRLRERGHFVQPKSGQEMVEEMEDLASPVGAFLRERCDQGPSCDVEVSDLFNEWKAWCEEKGRQHPGDVHAFGRDLRSVLPHLTTPQKTVGVGKDAVRKRFYQGIGLKSLVVPKKDPLKMKAF